MTKTSWKATDAHPVPNQRPHKASADFKGKLLEEKYAVSNFCYKNLQNAQLLSL